MTVRHRARRTVLTMVLWGCHAVTALAGWDEGDAAWKAQRYDEAWTQLKPLAEAGDTKAQNRLGVMLRNGQGVGKDEALAFQWFERAARGGLVRAQLNLGLAYLDAEGTPQDTAQALHWIGAAARQGNADAQVMFGYLHERGLGTPADPAEAVRWYRMAAESGDAEGQTYLAAMYRDGLGVPADAATARRWLHRAADQGQARAIYDLATMADAGEGGDVDLAAALDGYRRAAELGHAQAQAALGASYADGRGVAQDDAQAAHWYERAAAQGNGMALTNLGRMRMAGRGGPKDPAQAVALWRRAAAAGHPRGMAELGVALLDGTGVDADPAAGFEWLRKATDKGSLPGQFRLAWSYLEGDGVAQDARRACELFRQNADAGFAPGMREYGRRLELGEGCAKDLAQARHWYARAAEADDRGAMYRLGALHDNGRGVPVSMGHAVYWYVRAARLGHRDARNDLGVMYLDGEFVAQDLVIAAALFRLAAQDGQENSKHNSDRTEARLDAEARQRVTALVDTLRRPAGFDAALNDSLAAAQGLPSPHAAPAPASPCLPTPTVPAPEQLQAWHRDAHDRGPLWRITKDGHSSWLYGTLHAGRIQWLVPGPRILQALQASDVLAVETDLEGDAAQTAMARVRARMSALDRPEHQAHLDAQLGAECAAALARERVPQLIQAMIMGLRDAAAQQQYPSFGIDVFLTSLARRKPMPVMELESPDDALNALIDVYAIGNAARLQADLLPGPQRRASVLARLSRAWEQADLDTLGRYQAWCECADDAEARAALERLGNARNPGMADRIDTWHRQGQRVLAAAGALHMVGPRGLPALLAARGYQVERVMPERPVPEPLGELRVSVPTAQQVSQR